MPIRGPNSMPFDKQTRAELYLQAGDASRERGLRDVTALGRDGEARRVGDGQEIA